MIIAIWTLAWRVVRYLEREVVSKVQWVRHCPIVFNKTLE